MKKAKQGLSFIDKIFLWINIFLCAALLLSYLAPITDPAKYWFIAFFGLAYPILLVANLIMTVYWLLRRKFWILLPVICIVIGWSVLNKNIGLRRSSPYSPQPGNVRVMTYNVHNFKKYGSNNDVPTKQEILAIIAGENPDILGIQEFYTRRHGEYDMVDSILKIMNTTSYYFEVFQSSARESIGMAIFSKFPIIDHGLVQLSDRSNENQCLYVDVKKGAQTIRLYSIQLRSIRFDPYDYQYLNHVSADGKADVGSTKRLGSKLKDAFIRRSAQVFKVKDHAAKCPYPYIISGDFNDTPTSFAVNELSKGLKNTFCEKGSGFGRTYNGAFPNYQIDYILAGKQFDVASYQIIEKKLSDHYPVISDLVLR